MTTFTYCATDLLSGEILADTLPLNVQSFSMQLNGSGNLTATVDLDENYPLNAPFLTAVTPRRTVLWALAGQFPVWAGILWDWPDMTRAQGDLSLSAQTLDSLWAHRLITDTLEYPQVDLFTAFTDLCSYGMTKQSSYIEQGVSPPATRDPDYLAMVAQRGGVARLVLPQHITSGVPWTASYVYSDLTQVSSAWSDMTASGNLEYAFVPGLDENGHMAVFLRLGYTALGRPLAESGIVLSYPGNLLDYGWTITGSQSANMVWATAPPNGAELQWESSYPHGSDAADLAAYPLLESTISWEGSYVTSQSQVNSFADGQAALLGAGMLTPVVNVGGQGRPRVQDLQLGDSVQLALTSPIHPQDPVTGAPGYQGEMRITGWTMYPSGPQQSEYLQLNLSGVVAA